MRQEHGYRIETDICTISEVRKKVRGRQRIKIKWDSTPSGKRNPGRLQKRLKGDLQSTSSKYRWCVKKNRLLRRSLRRISSLRQILACSNRRRLLLLFFLLWAYYYCCIVAVIVTVIIIIFFKINLQELYTETVLIPEM